MFHQSKIVKMKVRLLTRSLRPTIARRLGEAHAPIDLLDDNGVAGWEIGVRRILLDLEDEREDSKYAREIRSWLHDDLEAERVRWRGPSTSIWQFRLALAALEPDADVVDEFFAVWRANLEAAIDRCDHWQAYPTEWEAATVRRLRAELTSARRGEEVYEALDTLSLAKSPHASVAVRDRSLLRPHNRRGVRDWLDAEDAQ